MYLETLCQKRFVSEKIRIAYINWYVSSIWSSRYHLPVIILSSYRRGGGGKGGEIDRSRL